MGGPLRHGAPASRGRRPTGWARLLAFGALAAAASAQAPALPAEVTPKIQEAGAKGLAWLDRSQGQDGSWRNAAPTAPAPAP